MMGFIRRRLIDPVWKSRARYRATRQRGAWPESE
jgi:hypothetical protein